MPDGICPFAEQIAGITTFNAGNFNPAGFCDHTASGFYTTLKDPAFWTNAGVSVHFGISRRGEICQIVNIFDMAFAQGRDGQNGSVGPQSQGITWPKFADMGQRNPNGYLISTEHEDAMTVNGQTTFVAGSEWTPEQYAADLRVKKWCVEEVRRVRQVDLLRFGIDALAGHHMFDPVNRTDCPGRFWRDSYRARLFADLRAGPQPVVAGPRVWLFGNEDAGEEVVGKQVLRWHLGINTDRYGDEAGQFPGRHFHNEGGAWVQKEP